MAKPKFLLSACATGFFAMAGFIGYEPAKESIKEVEGTLVQRYVQKQYERMYAAHPLRQGTTLPDLTFAEPSSHGEGSSLLGLYTRAGHLTPTIYINPNQCTPEAKGNVFELLAHEIRQLRCYAFADETLKHELAHHFVNERARSLGLAQFTSGEDFMLMDTLRLTGNETAARYNAVARTMVSEGIAEYYAKDHEQVVPYVPKTLPQMYGRGAMYAEYPAGFSLVTPILNKYGSRGIDLMLANPPVVETLADLPAWQEKILQN